MESTNIIFYNKYREVLDLYHVKNKDTFYIILFDDVLHGRKLSNRVSHIMYDFRDTNSIKVTWYRQDLLLLALLEEEFDTGYLKPECPEYFLFNNKKYFKFGQDLIKEIMGNKDVNVGYFICQEDVWIGKSF